MVTGGRVEYSKGWDESDEAVRKEDLSQRFVGRDTAALSPTQADARLIAIPRNYLTHAGCNCCSRRCIIFA